MEWKPRPTSLSTQFLSSPFILCFLTLFYKYGHNGHASIPSPHPGEAVVKFWWVNMYILWATGEPVTDVPYFFLWMVFSQSSMKNKQKPGKNGLTATATTHQGGVMMWKAIYRPINAENPAEHATNTSGLLGSRASFISALSSAVVAMDKTKRQLHGAKCLHWFEFY